MDAPSRGLCADYETDIRCTGKKAVGGAFLRGRGLRWQAIGHLDKELSHLEPIKACAAIFIMTA